MSFYPVLNAPNVKGWVGVCNFSPNNWEKYSRVAKFVNVTYPSKGFWITKNIGKLPYGKYKKVSHQELSEFIPGNTLALISLTLTIPAEVSKSLPKLNTDKTTIPNSRATLGLSSKVFQTSYQGELDPFPSQGTLLSFAPFLQFDNNVKNFLLLINLEESAENRSGKVKVYDANKDCLKGEFQIFNNSINVIPLDELSFMEQELPLFVSKDMASIPLYFSTTEDGSYMSLEHTHPPASLVVHGKRWDAQKFLKNRWFSKVNL